LLGFDEGVEIMSNEKNNKQRKKELLYALWPRWLWCKAPIHVTLIEMKTWDGAIVLETELDLFKFKQFESEIILLTIRWYFKYSLSYRNLVEMMEERGLHMAHTTIMRWVHQFGPELDKRIRPYLKPTNDSAELPYAGHYTS
jgi:hypothetical protein